MNNYKWYLFKILFLTSVFLLIVASVSYIIDPSNIYHSSYKNHNSPSMYVTRLLKSRNGLLWPKHSWNQRDLVSSLAQKDVAVDCAVIGSSHVMQVSSVRKNASIRNLCSTIINLGVSGGTLEDYLALSYMLSNKKQKPGTIVFGVDPWALDFNKDSRWERYRDSYYSMKEILEPDNINRDKGRFTRWKYIKNLINPSYFLRSIKQPERKDLFINEAPKFNHAVGIDAPVFLPDRSIIYSNTYIADSNASRIPVGGTKYKIRPEPVPNYSEVAIALFSKLVRKLNKAGINTVILMTPYHHNVWADMNSVTTKALLEVEPRIRKIGRDLGIKVLGSYNPDVIGCTPDEFNDFMHAKRFLFIKNC